MSLPNLAEEETMESKPPLESDSRWITTYELRDLPPSSMKRFDRKANRILLANIDNQIFAVDDTCTHEDASLSTGSLKGDLVKCPLHGSRFCVRDGRALEEPAETSLKCYPTRVRKGNVEVYI